MAGVGGAWGVGRVGGEMQTKPDRRMTVHTSKPTAFIANRAPESCVRVEVVVLFYQPLSTVMVLVHAVSVGL